MGCERMNGSEKQRLSELKEKLHNQLHQKAAQRARQRFSDEIPDFDLDFEFVDSNEQQKINAFVDNMPSISPTQLDLSCFDEIIRYTELSFFPHKEQVFFIVCLCGSKEITNILQRAR